MGNLTPDAGDVSLTDAEDDMLGGMLLAVWSAPSARRFTAAAEVVHKHVTTVLANHVAAAREADRAEVADWKRRRDAAVEQCRFLHQDGKTREEWHTDNCGAMREVRSLRERLAGLVAQIGALADEWETAHGNPPVDPSHISVRHAQRLHDLLATHPTPNASPDPAVVTPDAGDCGCPPDVPCDVASDYAALAAEADTEALAAVIAAEVWRIHGPESTDEESAEMDGRDIARAILASDWLANHVAATREADRAEVADLRDRYEVLLADNSEVEERLAEVEAIKETYHEEWMLAEGALAGLVAKIEALAHSPETDKYRDEACRGVVALPYASNRYVRLLDDLRALIPADAATALDAVKEKAWNEGHGTTCDGITSSLDGCEQHNPYRIARHTPEDGA